MIWEFYPYFWKHPYGFYWQFWGILRDNNETENVPKDFYLRVCKVHVPLTHTHKHTHTHTHITKERVSSNHHVNIYYILDITLQKGLHSPVLVSKDVIHIWQLGSSGRKISRITNHSGLHSHTPQGHKNLYQAHLPHKLPKFTPKNSKNLELQTTGQIRIIHQHDFPWFSWNKGNSVSKPPFGVRSCEVAIIWPETTKI